MLRKLIIAFWIFIGVMLLWQFHDYNSSIDQKIDEKPTQKQFFFYNTNTAPATSSKPAKEGADLRQISYQVLPNQPAAGEFTSHVTIKNFGNSKAVNVQIWIRPYRGITLGDEDNASPNRGTLSDSDPLAQFGQWLSLPDIAPGESVTRDVVFYSQNGVHPGSNPNPQFIFTNEKPKP